MPLSIGARVSDNVRVALELGLVCIPEEWE